MTLPATIEQYNPVMRKLSTEELDVIKQMYCKDLTPAEIQVFQMICERTGLSPAIKQIYAQKRKDRKSGKETLVIITGIDGFRWVSERTNRYAPGKETLFNYDKNGQLFSATVYIKKQTADGTWHEVSATAHWAEYCQYTYSNGQQVVSQFWSKMPTTMLEKCAEAKAHRKAFPFALAGVYSPEEMMQADNPPELQNTSRSNEIHVIPQHVSPEENQSMLDEFLNRYEDEGRAWMKMFVEGFCKHYNKSFKEFGESFENENVMIQQFRKWKEAKQKSGVTV